MFSTSTSGSKGNDMDDLAVDFPEEADNTQFQAVPLLTLEDFRGSILDVLKRNDDEWVTPTFFDFSIENEHFVGSIRIFILSKEFLTIEFPEQPNLFYLSGPGVLLDVSGEETDLWLEVGGQLTLDDPDSAPPGVLTVWHPRIDTSVDLLDAS